MRKLLAGTLIAASLSCMAESLRVEDFCDLKTAAPAEVRDMTPMPDGETYASLSEDGTKIELFSFKSGIKTGELFSAGSVKGDVKIAQVEGFIVSDNGTRVLLWTDKNKIYRNSFTAEYYLYDVGRQTLKRVSEAGPQRCATLSHDGRMVAYVRDNNVFISNLDYGTDRSITEDGVVNGIINGAPDWGYEEEFGVVNTLRWSGDDNVLAFLRFDESEVPMYRFDACRSYCVPDPLADPYPAQYDYKYSLAGYPVASVSVLAYDLNTRATKKMDLPIDVRDYLPSVEFDGKGENLMIVALNHDQNQLRLFRVNPASTVAHLLIEEKSTGWISPSAFGLNRYYSDFFVYGSERSGYCHLYKYNYDGVEQGALTKGDFNVTDYYGYNDKKGVHYLQTTSLGAVNRNVAVTTSNGGALSLLTGTPGWERALWSADFRYWLREWSDVSTPTIYSLRTADGKGEVTIQDNASYKAKYSEAPKKELLKIRNSAGEEMDAYIIKPYGFDETKKYPVLMYQYNGPDSQEVTNKWRIDGLDYIASQGYIVGCVDGRGTGFRSRSWAYAVYKDLGNIETSDQIDGALYFASLQYVDNSRIGCFGWSYGGYMTLMELQREGNPFKCGVSMAPVTDWRFYDSIYTERYMLTPQQNEKGYNASSALKRTVNLNVPLLIMSGTSDDNVHFYNTLKYTSKLTSEGKLFDMMAYTGFDHSLRMCNARVQLYRKIVQFLKINL